MSEQAITKKDIFKYVALPGIRPRLFELFGRGFQHIPFFIALVFECVRLIPRQHPYLNPVNIGRFGIRHVIAEAANNIVFTRRNIDQIIVFGLILLALIIVLVQMLTLFLALFIQPSMALPANFGEFFLLDQGYMAAVVPGGTSSQQDIAMMLLDMVFGVPGMFESCADLSALGPGVNCQDGQGVDILMPDDVATAAGLPAGNPFLNYAGSWPYPIHEGLHQMFAVYSYGLLLIAVFITIYFMFVVLAETAQSGTAFGKRFNKVWAPIRIVVAFGLLVPITFGMNSGQFVVLYAAKFGSSFATNGWAYFNDSITNHYTDGVQRLASTPGFPEFGVLSQFFFTAATCKAGYMLADRWTEVDTDQSHIVPYLVRGGNAPNNALPFTDPGPPMPAYGAIATAAPDYDTLTSTGGFLNGATRAIIRFGKRDEQNYGSYLGNVKPFCGEIVMNFSDTRPGAAIPPNGAEPGIQVLQRFYFWLIKALWWTEGRLNATIASAPIHEHVARSKISDLDWDEATQPLPAPLYRTRLLAEIESQFRDVLTGSGGSTYLQGGHGDAITALSNSPSWNVNAALIEKGWGGAAIWYNRIAAMNGALTSAVFNIPLPSKYPAVMEYTKNKKIQYDQDTDPEERFEPRLPNGDTVPYPRPLDSQYAQAMYEAYRFWAAADYGTSTQTQPTGNVMIDSINAILGTNGLFDMRKNTDVHPLAQLVGVGRGLVESSIRNLGYAAVGGASGGILRALANFNGGAQLAGVGASFLITTAMIGLTAGFILFYIVPFLPFIYFFFAVGGWIKGIFEAMVGVPLWALAHIRIDGPGLPGQAAINGYFLIFEIFLRPILILFGFLASILIFGAMVEVLNDIFDLIVGNLGGFDPHEELNDTGGTGTSYIGFYRTAIDEFFFTLIYAIVVYMMGQSSFKLIDQIPNNMLRWMNQNVATFNDSRQDPAQGLVSTAQIGAQQGLQSMGGGLQSMVKASTG